MAGNGMIRMLRGTSDKVAESTGKLEAGQPLYITDKNYLTVGDGTKNVKAKPITVREVQGWWKDKDNITAKGNADPDYTISPSNNWLNILSNNNLGIHAIGEYSGKKNEIKIDFTPSDSTPLTGTGIRIEAENGVLITDGRVGLTVKDNQVTSSCNIIPYGTMSIDIGENGHKFNNVYANNFKGIADASTNIVGEKTSNSVTINIQTGSISDTIAKLKLSW